MTCSTDAEMAALPSRRTVVLASLGAAAAAFVILFAGVLPAEYDRDPTGLGKLTGISRLWAPEQQVATADTKAAGTAASRSYPAAFRSDMIEIPLTADENPEGGNELEYKVHLERGGSYIYSWEVAGISNPEEFYSEFHGHTTEPGKAMTLGEYRKTTGTFDNGILTAPFSGAHGWYFQNQSLKPVTVRLKLSGFYTLIAAGEAGNEAGLRAKAVDF